MNEPDPLDEAMAIRHDANLDASEALLPYIEDDFDFAQVEKNAHEELVLRVDQIQSQVVELYRLVGGLTVEVVKITELQLAVAQSLKRLRARVERLTREIGTTP